MPLTPYARLKMTIDGGAPTSGGQIVSGGNLVQLFGESTAHWEDQLWEIYEYPDGFALPSGWQDVNGVYRSAAVTPPPFTIEDVTLWGKYFFRLTVDGGFDDEGDYHGPDDEDQPLVDNHSALSVLSTNGFHDYGYGESNQFDSFRQSVGELKITLRAIDAMGGGSGGGLPGGSNGQFQYKNGVLFAGASGFIYDSVNSRAQAVASFAIKNSANAFQAIIAATAQAANHTFTIPNVASDTFVFEDAAQTITNKTIDAADNAIIGTGADIGDILVFDGSKFNVFDVHSQTDGTYFGVEGGVVGFFAPAGSGGGSVGTNTVQISNGSGAFLSAANATYAGGFLTLATALKLTDSGHATSLLSGTLAADVSVALPAATTRLMGFDTTDVMTHKTYDVEAAGNVLTAASAGSGSLLVHNGSKFVAFPVGAIAGQLLAVNPTLDGYVFVNPGGGGGGGGTLPNFVSVSGTTVGATTTNLVLPDASEIVLDDDTTYSLYVDIIGTRTDADGDARKHIELLVRVDSGVITVEDSTTVVDAPNGMTWTVAFSDAGSRTFRVAVTGTALQTIAYTAFITTGGPMVGAGSGTGASSDGPITMLQTSNGTGGFTGASGFFAGSGNMALASAASYGAGVRVFHLGAATANPSTSPASGGIFYVDATDGYLKLKKANGQVVALNASSGDPAILSQTTWFIDSVAGNDNDTGLTGHPLKTWAELTRRWGVGAVLVPSSGTCTVQIIGDLTGEGIRLPAHLRTGTDCKLIIKGTRTTVRSGTFTSRTVLNRATNTPWDATDSALGSGGAWTANLGQRVRITSGGNAGQTMWVAEDLGSKKARLSAPATIPADGTTLHVTQGTFTTDPYTVETLSLVAIDDVSIGGEWGTAASSGSVVVFADMDIQGIFAAVSAPNALVQFSGCTFDAVLAGFFGSSAVTLLNCALQCPTEAATLEGTAVLMEAGMIRNGDLTLLANSSVQLDADVLVQGQSINVGNDAALTIGTAGVFGSAGNGITVGISDTGGKLGGNALLRIQTGLFTTHALYGAANTGAGVAVSAGSIAVYQTNVPTIAGASDFTLGGATALYGFDMTTGAYVGTSTSTWAHLAAALAAGTGFGDNAHNPQKDAHFLKGS